MSDSFSSSVLSGEPLVSAIVTSFKKAEYLRETITCFKEQTWKNLEVIVVNDGSPDNTTEVVNGLIREFSPMRIQLIEKPNGGVSDARNVGFERAKGRVVMALDGDDKIKPTYIEKAIVAFRTHGVNLFCSNQENFGLRPGEWIPKAYDPFNLRYDNCIPSCAVFDKSLWERAGGFEPCLGFVEDWALWVRFTKFDLRVFKSDEKLSMWRVTDAGLQSEFIDNKWRDCFSMVVLSNDDLYPVDEVLATHDFLPSLADSAKEKIRKLSKLHDTSWLGHLMVGLLAEGSSLAEASESYRRAVELSKGENWQPLFRLGLIFEKNNHKKEAVGLYHIVRTIRPDMGTRLNEKIKELLK